MLLDVLAIVAFTVPAMETKVFYREGDRWSGKTKYRSEAEALRAGYRTAKK
jgi:hypothetical protein